MQTICILTSKANMSLVRHILRNLSTCRIKNREIVEKEEDGIRSEMELL